MYGYIYFTENLVNGRCYIGKHVSKEFDPTYKGSGIALKSAIKKYGWDNFVCQPIQWCETKEELNEAERWWVDKCNAKNSDLFYNLTGGGGGDCYHPNHGQRTWTDEQRADFSERCKGKVPWNKGKKGIYKQSEETIAKRSQSLRGKKRKPCSDEAKANISKGRKNIEPWNKGLTGVQEAWNKGVPMNEETKQKLSKKLKGRVPWNKGKKLK